MKKVFLLLLLIVGFSFAIVPDASVTARQAVGDNTLSYTGTADAPSYTFVNDLNTGLYPISADVIGISAGGTKVGEFNAYGLGMGAATVVDTTATTDATVNITAQFLNVDTHQDVAISTVNVLTGGKVGTEVFIMTVTDNRDVIFAESTTLLLGAATRTLDDNADILRILPVTIDGETIYVESGFLDNN